MLDSKKILDDMVEITSNVLRTYSSIYNLEPTSYENGSLGVCVTLEKDTCDEYDVFEEFNVNPQGSYLVSENRDYFISELGQMDIDEENMLFAMDDFISSEGEMDNYPPVNRVVIEVVKFLD